MVGDMIAAAPCIHMSQRVANELPRGAHRHIHTCMQVDCLTVTSMTKNLMERLLFGTGCTQGRHKRYPSACCNRA